MKGVALLLVAFFTVNSTYGKTIQDKSTVAENDDCQEVIETVRKGIDENKELMKKFAKGVCKYISSMSCDEYQKKVLEFSLNEKEAKQFCTSLRRGRALSMHIRDCVTGEKYCPYLCKRCTKTVAMLNRVIKMMNATAGEIEAVFKANCNILKLDNKTCDTIISYFDKIVQSIIDEVSPGDICVELKFCNSSSTDGNIMDGFKNYMNKIRRRGRNIMKSMFKLHGSKTRGSFPNFLNGKQWRKSMREHLKRIKKIQRQFKNIFKNTGDFDNENPLATTTVEPEIVEEEEEEGDDAEGDDAEGDDAKGDDADDDNDDDDDLMNIEDKWISNKDDIEAMNKVLAEAKHNRVIGENPYLAYDFPSFGHFFKKSKRIFEDLPTKDIILEELSPKDWSTEDLPTEDIFPEDLTPKDWNTDSLKDLYDPSKFKEIKGSENIFEKEDEDEEEDPLRGLLPTFTLPSIPNLSFFNKELDKMMKLTKEQLKTLEEKSSSLRQSLTGKSLKNGIGCTACKAVVEVIEYEIKTVNASEQQIKKIIEAICSLYPIEAAKEACKKIVEEVDEVIQLIEKDVDPKDICVELKLCPSKQNQQDGGFKVETKTYVKPTGDCNSMCGFWKNLYGEDVSEVMELWVETKERIIKLCQENKYKIKCFSMLRTFEKAESQLGAVLTQEEMNNSNSTEKYCKCFKNQPVFVTKKHDTCQLCRQMEKGLSKDISNVKKSISYLIEQINTFCTGVTEQQEECFEIIDIFKTSFENLDKRMEATDELCNRIGYCVEEEKEFPWKNMMKHMMTRAESLFPSILDGDLFGSPLSCNFCKTCMKNINSTMKVINANSTNIEENTPVLKDGFAIFCRSQKTGDEVKQVCKRIYNGMETIQKTLISKKEMEDGSNDDMSAICKEFKMC